jgi:hypothetical protein
MSKKQECWVVNSTDHYTEVLGVVPARIRDEVLLTDFGRWANIRVGDKQMRGVEIVREGRSVTAAAGDMSLTLNIGNILIDKE